MFFPTTYFKWLFLSASLNDLVAVFSYVYIWLKNVTHFPREAAILINNLEVQLQWKPINPRVTNRPQSYQRVGPE